VARVTRLAVGSSERSMGLPTAYRLKRGLTGYLFVLPTLIFVGYFLYYPAYRALTGAFTDWDGFNPPEWIGLENFRRAFSDAVLREAARNNLIWAFFDVLLAIVPAFTVAELIFHVKRARLKYLYRTLFIVPAVVPFIVTVLLWRYYYQSDGLINLILGKVGLSGLERAWISDPGTALLALALMGFPWVNAFNMLIFYAGLQHIAPEVLESAELEGATGLRRIWTIDLPLVLAQFKLLVVLALITSGQNILVPLLMTNGGPGYSTYTPALYMYDTAVEYGDFGYSMAISFMLFVLILGLTALNIRFIRER
jgi:raffinose/stachyose/melibiose transport system permease protein